MLFKDIPTTEQREDCGKPYTLYVIKIMDPELHQWEKRYRYRDLLVLHKYVMKNYPTLIDKTFPDKTYLFFNKNIIYCVLFLELFYDFI